MAGIVVYMCPPGSSCWYWRSCLPIIGRFHPIKGLIRSECSNPLCIFSPLHTIGSTQYAEMEAVLKEKGFSHSLEFFPAAGVPRGFQAVVRSMTVLPYHNTGIGRVPHLTANE